MPYSFFYNEFLDAIMLFATYLQVLCSLNVYVTLITIGGIYNDKYKNNTEKYV